jgi:hypothetical protein
VGLAATVSGTKPRCTFGAAAGSKNLSLTKKAPLAGVAAIWASAARRNASYSRHVMAKYDEKFLCGILFNFF